MATAYITEFREISKIGAQIAQGYPVAQNNVAIGGASAQSAAFNNATRYIRVHVDAICSIRIGSNPSAAATDARMAADNTEYFGVQSGDKIAVIANT